jgi:hypothetical protein
MGLAAHSGMSIALAPTETRAVLPALPEGGYEPIPGNLSFDELLTGLNPLHHLPVVGTIYREATGERIAPVMRVIGGALFGGPLGMLSSAVMAALDEIRSAPATPPAQRLAAAARYHDDAA